MHIRLSACDANEVVAHGWGEYHPLAGKTENVFLIVVIQLKLRLLMVS